MTRERETITQKVASIAGACLMLTAFAYFMDTMLCTIAKNQEANSNVKKAIIIPNNKNLHNIRNKNDNKVDF